MHILRVLLYPYVLNVQIHLCTLFFSFSFFYLFPIISMFQTEKEMVCFFINEPECRSFIFLTVFKTLDKCIQNNRFFYKLICLFLTNVTFYDSIIFIFFFTLSFHNCKAVQITLLYIYLTKHLLLHPNLGFALQF